MEIGKNERNGKGEDRNVIEDRYRNRSRKRIEKQ